MSADSICREPAALQPSEGRRAAAGATAAALSWNRTNMTGSTEKAYVAFPSNNHYFSNRKWETWHLSWG